MEKLIITRGQDGEIITDVQPLSQEEIAAMPQPQEPEPVSYPTAQIVSDRVTDEPYEVFVENDKLGSEPLVE